MLKLHVQSLGNAVEQWIGPVNCHSLSEAALSSVPHTWAIVSKAVFSLSCCFVQRQMGEFLGNTGHGSLFLSLYMSVSASEVHLGLGIAEPHLTV